ncbi:MAG: DUF1730 domain-containing protein [Candidatus Peregrinibacteria bacterium]|nr:DUF1730 domain-containing protein [Candidatus Peregrinibacteria bacterium]
MGKILKKTEGLKNAINKTKSEIEIFALSIGFDLVGFSPAKIDKKYFDAYKKWLGKGMNAGMKYMAKSAQRKDVSKNLKNAKTVISLGVNYFHPQENKKILKDEAIIARYAYGRDYHKIISKKLKQFSAYLKEKFPNEFTKSYVDTGPILERAYAETSGIGQIGKNGCVITKAFGSWIFLSEVITTIDLCHEDGMELKRKGGCSRTIACLEIRSNARSADCDDGICYEGFRTNIPQAPLVAGRGRLEGAFITNSVCGSCTRCIDACPTGAIIAPGIIDSRKCISYQTIENKGRIPKKIADAIKKTRRIFGCDICQEVCPHNIGKQKITTHPEFLQKIAGDKISLKKTIAIKSDEAFLQTYAGSPLMRAKLKKLKSTAKIIFSN